MIPPCLRTRYRKHVDIRPALGVDLESADGRVDFVAVDDALHGRPVPLNRYEMDEVCRVLHRLSTEYHSGVLSMGRADDESSPFAIVKALLIEAYGPEFEKRYLLYRNKVNVRKKRATAKGVPPRPTPAADPRTDVACSP